MLSQNHAFKFKTTLTICLLICLSHSVVSQSLSISRVKKIKESTVRISIDGLNTTGTGFFVNTDGLIVTCWHVIEPALIVNPATNKLTGTRRIFIKLYNNELLEFGIPIVLLNNYNDAVAYDYCILVPKVKRSLPFPFLKLGNFDTLKEGQEVYTCGYPLGIEQQFITKGTVSTKYVDSTLSVNTGSGQMLYKRSQALLDLTLNRGNSGGAIIALNEDETKDEVIGIADFIINPVGGNAVSLIRQLQSASGGVLLNGIDTNQMLANLVNVLSNTSIGISGCVSINHFTDGVRKMR
jgi:serine protease Do